jgi:hypothetical protein
LINVIVSTAQAVTQVQTVKRKRLSFFDGDPMELILVIPGAETEGDTDFEETLVVTYPVMVIISQPQGNLINSSSMDRMLDLRSVLHYHLRTVTLTQFANAEILNVTCNLQPQFDRAGARDNRDISGLELLYSIRQPRKT